MKAKNQAAYKHLAGERGFDHAQTWTIDDSSRSDINPALAARLSAVYVPHPRTGSMERAEAPEGQSAC